MHEIAMHESFGADYDKIIELIDCWFLLHNM